MNYPIRIAALLIVFVIFVQTHVCADTTQIAIPQQILVYQDVHLKHSPESILNMPADSGKYYPIEDLSFDFFNSAIWCSFSLKNDADIPIVRYLSIDNADFYSLELSTFCNGQLLDHMKEGKTVPSSQKQMDYFTPIFRVELPPHCETTCLLRVYKLGGAAVLPLNIVTAEELLEMQKKTTSSKLVYYGMLIFVVIFNLFLLVIMRRWLFLKYSLYVLLSIFSISGISGLGAAFLYPEFTWLAVRDTVLFNFPGTMLLLLFVKDFLNLREKRPNLNLLFNILMGLQAIGFILALFSPLYIGIASLYSNITTLFSILLVISTAIASIRTEKTSAIFILISYVPLLSSVIAFFLRTFGLLNNTDALMGLDFSLTFQTFTLTMAIVEGFRRDEMEQRRIIKESNAMLSKLTLAARETDNAIAIFSRYGDLEWCNKGYENIMQLNAQELKTLLGPHITDISLNPNIGNYYRLATETASSVVFETEYIGVTGEKRWMQTTLTPVADSHGGISNYISVDTDLTSLKRNEEEKDRLQEQLLRSQKMESVGKLAGGIAHDFNNILTPIIGYTDIMLAELPEDSPMKEDLTTVLNAAQRAKKLVAQILTFSRHFKEEAYPLAVSEAIDEVFKLLSSSLPKNIEMTFENRATNDNVFADPTQVQQILMNLCTNAYQSIVPGYGKMALCVENIYISNETQDLRIKRLNPGEYLHISVSDTGQGMDKHTLEHLCDPFFTTKEVGKGTGLGLSVVHGIVIKYQGELVFDSQQGKGTVAHVYLPTCSESVMKNCEAKKKVAVAGNKSSFESILVVDDEPNIVNMLGRVLQKNGFLPHCYTSSSTALYEYALAPDKYDLIIADQTMPQMSGAELASEILKINPFAKIIILTGYSETLNAELANSIGIRTLLYKPINVQVLLNKVYELIEEGKADAGKYLD